MAHPRGPHHSNKCPFHITQNHPLTAEKSISRCVECVTCGNPRLKRMRSDLHQIAYLTVLENSPKYDPSHQTGAPFRTFIRSCVCGKLWDERKKSRQSIPLPAVEAELTTHPLADGLATEACQCEAIDETVAWHVDVETFKTLLPKLLSCLSEKEGIVLKSKFFDELKAVEIAKRLGISEGRVSQLYRSALTKLEKAYLFHRKKDDFIKN